MNRVFDALRCFADLLSYDNKRFAQIALRRIGILSLTRPAAGEESCKAGFFFAHKVALPSYLFVSRFSCEHEICPQTVRVNCNIKTKKSDYIIIKSLAFEKMLCYNTVVLLKL